MKGLRTLKKWVADYNNAVQLGEDLEVLYDFYKAGDAEESELTSFLRHRRLYKNHRGLLNLSLIHI